MLLSSFYEAEIWWIWISECFSTENTGGYSAKLTAQTKERTKKSVVGIFIYMYE